MRLKLKCKCNQQVGGVLVTMGGHDAAFHKQCVFSHWRDCAARSPHEAETRLAYVHLLRKDSAR